jgi:hypothetical protein
MHTWLTGMSSAQWFTELRRQSYMLRDATGQLGSARGKRPRTKAPLSLDERQEPAILQYEPTGRAIMSQRAHERAAELHNLAAHAHMAAAVAHGKEDHLTAHELSKQAHEHSMNAHKLAEELNKKTTKSNGAEVSTQNA